jgi:uncharacterized protein
MSEDLHFRLVLAGPPGEISRPAPEKVLAGTPEHRTWLAEDRAALCAGIWQSTPGTWRVSYDEWEYFRILSGVSVLTDDNGVQTRLVAGDSHIIRPGFSGTWQVVEETTKDFVIVL